MRPNYSLYQDDDSEYYPEADPAPVQPARKKRRSSVNRRILLLLGGGFIVMVALWALVLASSGGISGVLDLLFAGSGKMTVEIRAPASAHVGEEVSLVIRIRNLSDEFLEIDEILFPQELLQAVVVLGVFPGSSDQHERGSLTGFEVGYAIAPQESIDFTVTLQAIGAIDFQGEVQIRSGWSRERAETRVVIIGPGGVTVSGQGISVEEFGPNVPYRSVVKITARHLENGQMVTGWSGSGSIISSDGLILTNAHVVLPDRFFPVDELIVSLTTEPDQLPVDMYRAQVLQADRQLDIAVIRITTDLNRVPVNYRQLDLPVVELGDANALQLGDPLAILGYPGIGGDTITLTRGEVSGFTRDQTYGDRAFIKTSAAIAGGNSGGLVADERGFLIAIPTQVGSGGDNLLVDCRVIADTNRDGEINSLDSCVPTGGFINALRPINLALPLIEAAVRGEIHIVDLATPDIALPAGSVLLYSDDFSSQGSGWNHGGGQDGFVGYQNGEYHVEVEVPYYIFWGTAHNIFVDTVITVRARIVTPAGDADYGVICRYRDENNFYAMSITEDRYAAIWKIQDGEHEMLMDWIYSNEIPRYESATITAACLSNELTLAVNGVVLGRVYDYSFSSGDIGLFGGVWEDPGFTIAFDNIEVRSP
jgi:S1-C subfamily serine protease